VCYSALILACSRLGDAKKAEAWVSKMAEDQVVPNVQCYNNVISACARCRAADRAQEWFAKMLEAGVKPNSSTYCGLVDAWSRMGDTARAERTLAKMRQEGIQPNAQCYTFLARAHARNGSVPEVEALAAEMVAAGIPVDEYFLTVQLGVYAAARPRQGDRASEVFLEAVKKGAQSNQHVLSSLSRCVGMQQAQRLAEEAKALKQTPPWRSSGKSVQQDKAPPPGL